MSGTFDIFSGHQDGDAVWLEAVEGLGTAYERMKKLARDTPGRYFIFDAHHHKVLALTDSSLSQDGSAPVDGNSASRRGA